MEQKNEEQKINKPYSNKIQLNKKNKTRNKKKFLKMATKYKFIMK